MAHAIINARTPVGVVAGHFGLAEGQTAVELPPAVLTDAQAELLTPEQAEAVLAYLRAQDLIDAPVIIPAVPSFVWRWQFAGQAAAEGIITVQEAKDWSSVGDVPSSLAKAVDAAVTDPAQHDKVVLFLMGASQIPRAHPLVSVLGAAFGKDTPDKLDAFFAAAGAR